MLRPIQYYKVLYSVLQEKLYSQKIYYIVHAIIKNMIDNAKLPKDRTKYLAKSLGLDKVHLRTNNTSKS